MASKKKGSDISRSQLSNTAIELNHQLGLTADDEVSPGIDPKAKKEALEKDIREAGAHVDPNEDELTELTWNVLEKLGAAHRPAQEYVPDRSSEEATQAEPPSREEVQESNEQESSLDEGEFEPQTAEPNEQQQTALEKATPKNKKGGKAKSGKKSEESKQQQTASSSNKSGPASKPKRFADDQIITVLAKENPKRSGSKCRDRFDLYKSGITVKQYVEAGGKRDDVRWDSEKGYVQVQ